MKTMFAIVSLSVLSAGFGLGQDAGKDTAPKSPEMLAVIAKDRAYEEAYAKADADALAAFFTEDAEYTSDDGRSYSGNAAIKACLRAAFASNKGAKLAINADSVKVLTPEVVVEKGSTKVVSKNGEENGGLYIAVYVKKDGQWKISQLVETPMPDIAPGERLAELNWLVGEWEEADKEAGVTVHSRYQWAQGGNFITRNVTVKRGSDSLLESWQVIGWDPVEGAIRSWTFDDQGGHSGGLWTHEGQRWLARETGYAPDGSRTGADLTITKVDDDRFYWESGNRILDGDPQPSSGRIEINRVKGK